MHIVLLSTSGKGFHSYSRDHMTHEPKILYTNTCSETNMTASPERYTKVFQFLSWNSLL